MSAALTLAPVTALAVPEKGSPLPVFTGLDMTQALTAYRELQQALDRAMPDQIMQLDGKPFRKKGYWRAIAVAFNLTVEPVEERREVHGTLDDGSDNYVYVVTYVAKTSTQRAATGDGACAAAEKQRGRMKASEHNVRSHAHTRAYNRSVSNLVGFGEVSAEEIEREDRPVLRAVAPTLVKPAGFDDWLDGMTATAAQGTAALNQAWTTSSPVYRRYLTTTHPARWAAIKAQAEAVTR
jgi:hypothetical protein